MAVAVGVGVAVGSGVGDAVAVGEGGAACAGVAVGVAVDVGVAVGSGVGDVVAVGEEVTIGDVTSGALSSHAVMVPRSSSPRRMAEVGKDQLVAMASGTPRRRVQPPSFIRLSLWELCCLSLAHPVRLRESPWEQ